MTNEPIQARRRWFQYRLRTLLVAMLVISLGMGWVIKERRRIAERREVLETAGLFANAKYEQPAWRTMMLGDDWPAFFSSIDGSSSNGLGIVAS